MTAILIIALVILMGLVVYSLVRGIIAFLQSTREDLEDQSSDRASELQLMQNKMMFNRIKYQALAIVVVAVLLAVAS
ncbi:HIG1 domain-containing protein [Erythrobacter sp. LQ02-29]|uniref:HIG1 domain-containing protein n=1 Tax=Erythrobacter sp. LQ02-29 TaxID=2920384 RepID=UPI001F4ED343|nr:HIG1 domain-containing protein [Erythrobacter sp. LQ02-29]MCP9221671.1 HIG1 domain-containing protein [Erythrobacter sp. LQ02-29]